MRCPFLPPPRSREAAGGVRVHEAVRDWPELLPLLQEGGVDLSWEGGTLLADLFDREVLSFGQIRDRLAWRRHLPGPGAGPGDVSSTGSAGVSSTGR